MKMQEQIQHKLISAWIEKEILGGWAWVKISNQSELPFTKLILSIVNVQGKSSKGSDCPNEFRSFVSIVPPGEYFAKIQVHHGMSFISGIELAFIDHNLKSWVINGDGKLFSISKTPPDYYSIPLPIAWQRPELSMS